MATFAADLATKKESMASNPDFRALEPVAPLPLADAVATAEGECLHFLTTETGRSLTPDLIESLYSQFRGVIAGLVDDLAQAEEPAAPEVVGSEWQPCVKLPITVHVREQRPGEQHVSTREGITPVRPDDLIMRGVAGEEYPIGRELFQRTYRMGSADEPAAPEGREPAAVTGQAGPTDDQLLATHDRATASFPPRHPDAEALNAVEYSVALELRKARAVLARWGNPAPTPPADGEVAELVKLLQYEAREERPADSPSWCAAMERAAELLQRGQAE